MPRCARNKVANSVYHIIIRGNNKEAIFKDDEDRKAYLLRVRQYMEKYKMHILAYCLMTNHVHILIYDNDQDISKFMQGLSLSYTIYFNHKYGRTGHLYGDRFTSVIEKGDIQLIYTSRYIHRNPVKANIVKVPLAYKWSSYKAYLRGKDSNHIINIKLVRKLITNNMKDGMKGYLQYVNSDEEIAMRDYLLNKKYAYRTDEEIAITKESDILQEVNLRPIKKLNYEEAYSILYTRWKQEHGENENSEYD